MRWRSRNSTGSRRYKSLSRRILLADYRQGHHRNQYAESQNSHCQIFLIKAYFRIHLAPCLPLDLSGVGKESEYFQKTRKLRRFRCGDYGTQLPRLRSLAEIAEDIT